MYFRKFDIKKIILVFLLMIPFLTGTIYLFLKTPILPIIAFVSLFLTSVLYKSRYRIYSLIFFTPLTSFLGLKIGDKSIGSLLTLMIFVYLIEIIVEVIINYKKNKVMPNFSLLIPVSLLVFVMFIINLTNYNTIDFVKFISIVLYWLLPFLFIVDQKADKNCFKILFCLIVSYFLINVYSFLFIYVLKSFSVEFVTTYLPPIYKEYLNKLTLSDFRFPGMIGDPNHNSLVILTITSLSLFYLYKFKVHKKFLIIAIIILQFFCFIGGSKTYIVGLIILIFSSIFLFCRKLKVFPFILIFSALFLVLSTIILLAIPSISKSLTRLLLIDDRAGFLEAFTTNRASIWEEYLSNIGNNPIRVLIGHGTQAERLCEGADYHNSFIEVVWEYGIVGTIVWLNYFRLFVKYNDAKSKKMFLVLLILLITYGLSLHIIYQEILYISLFAFNRIVEGKSQVANLQSINQNEIAI